MSYNCTAIEVMIASPSDVAKERRITAEVIHTWNTVNSYKTNVVLMPLAWETHSTPTMGTPPQEVINESVLERADLLIGIFWTRIGTPTEDSESGSIEEIEKHVNSGKPAMLYFSDQPVVPDSIDHEQYEKLTKFKEKCRTEGLVETYSDLAEYREKLARQLSIKINEDEKLQELISITVPESNLFETNINVEPLNPEILKLSEEAKRLLVEASQDQTGNILKLRHSEGFAVQTNGKDFVADNSPRTIALWESAVDELEAKRLIEDRGYKGEVYSITNSGYQVADALRDSLN